jgi:hypothetical protein
MIGSTTGLPQMNDRPSVRAWELGTKMYEASTNEKVAEWNNFWTEAYVQNHFYIDHSALGMTGLALLGR